MRTLLLVVGLWLLPNALFSQASVRTEAASNRYKNYSAATTGDTLIIKTTKPVGSSIVYDNTIGGYVEGVAIGSPVASDTIIVKNGTGTVLQIILPATAPFETWYQIGARVDTNLVYIQKKGSNASLIFRPNY